MGAKKFIVAIILLCSVCTITVNALTADELYQQLGIPFTRQYSENDLKVIQDYNYAKRYVSMFRYVSEANPNTTVIDNRIRKLEEDKISLEKELLLGFDKSLTEIYELESEYQTNTIRLAEALTSKISVDKDFSRVNVDDIPSYREYIQAMQNKQLVDIQSNLGDSEIKVTPNTYVVYDYTDDYVTYGTTENSFVTSMFNGIVIFVSEDIVTIDHYNNIVSSFKGITPDVKVGDTVYQGGIIGKSNGKFTVKLRVNGELVNVYELLEE